MLKKFLWIVIFIFFIFDHTNIFAVEKTWSGGGDAQTWTDDNNWSSLAKPVLVDDILIDLANASVFCTETFMAKSIILGGRKNMTLTINHFSFGTITPSASSEVAILNRRDGKLILKGAGGVVTIKGQYKDSEETLVAEPSFMFWVK